MIDPHAYTITVRRREIEGEAIFEAKVAELPDLIGFGENYQEAYEFVIDIIAELAADAEKEGVGFPVPNDGTQDDYSGRITLRLSPRIHRLTAEAAKRECVSLNTFITTAIVQEYTKADIIDGISDALEQATFTSPVYRMWMSGGEDKLYAHQITDRQHTRSTQVDEIFYITTKVEGEITHPQKGDGIAGFHEVPEAITAYGDSMFMSTFKQTSVN